jgi:adenosylcobinamide kinase / adenosylcobinamide-phosphate guanylyltransferase
VDALIVGTGGAHGWPEDGCRCASCMRARSAGRRRAPGGVIVGGWLEVVPGKPFQHGTGPPPTSDLRIEQLPGGLDITGPDGGRLLLAAGPGEVPDPPPGTRPYDVALLDLLASPEQLGQLRASGLVRQGTSVVALYTDHRVSSEEEMGRRCSLWAARQGRDGQLINSRSEAAPVAAARPHRTLIIGGARSGKSTEAELRLAAEPRVTYLAAGPFPPVARPRPEDDWPHDDRPEDSGPEGRGTDAGPRGDDQSWRGPDGEPDTEWARRVAVHQSRRPPWWRTVESLDIAGALQQETGALLIDGIGTWLAAVMDEAGLWADEHPVARTARPGYSAAEVRRDPEEVVRARIDELIGAWRQTRALVVAVTDQVGSGLVPAYPAGRVFRDQLGWLNQRIAAETELNLQVTAGRVTTLPG